MKKIIFILILFLSCFLIYKFTMTDKINYVVIGDAISSGIDINYNKTKGYSLYLKDYFEINNRLKFYNDDYTDDDYRITDITNFLKYNKTIDDNNLSQLLKKADIVTLSLGYKEIYSRLNNDTNNIYLSINELMLDMDELFNLMSKHNHSKKYILGYYNIYNKYNDVFNYANYKLKKLANKYDYYFVDLNDIKNPEFLEKSDNFIPNNKGYYKISQLIVEKIKKT